MTAAEWFATRAPAQDAALARRIRELAAPVDQGDAPIAERCVAAAERALQRLVEGQMGSRDAALDLLAVDALVTYAFESAAGTPHRLESLAADAMRRFSLVAAGA